jgi:hypothetical protein
MTAPILVRGQPDGAEDAVVHRPDVEVVVAALGAGRSVDDQRGLDPGLGGGGGVGGHRPAADLFEGERHERGARWHAERALAALGVAPELVKQFIGDRIEHVGDADGVLADELAAQQQEVVGR